MAKCTFCNIIDKKAPATIIDEDKDTITILDIRPLFPGHCLILPKQHVVTLADLPPELVEPLFQKARQLSAAIPKALGSQGTFIAINNIVSQSVPHLHVHVVPRTKGDGLKGFFWPRNGYENEEHVIQVANKIKKEL